MKYFEQSSRSESLKTVWPLSLLAGVGLAYTWLAGHWLWGHFALPQQFSGLSICLFKQLFHVPCVFCGMTRSFISIGQGQWLKSVSYHPLGIPVYLAALALLVLAPFYPVQANKVLKALTRKAPVIGACVILVGCWLWKLGQSDQFW